MMQKMKHLLSTRSRSCTLAVIAFNVCALLVLFHKTQQELAVHARSPAAPGVNTRMSAAPAPGNEAFPLWPLLLESHEESHTSQQGEDGVIEFIFQVRYEYAKTCVY